MKKSIVLTTLAMLFCVSPVLAAAESDLEQQVRELARQNQALLERVAVLEKIAAGREHSAQPADLRPKTETIADPGNQEDQADEEQSLGRMLSERVTLSGLVEVEADSVEDYAGDMSDDITLATVELGIDAGISAWSQAHVLLLSEEGEEDARVTVDEGTITLGHEEFPASLVAGRMYFPFGVYESNMVSDTLPLALGEISDTGVLAGYRLAGFRGEAYVFNGDLTEQGGSGRIDAWGASLGYVQEAEEISLSAGLDWLSSIGDTNGLGDYLEENTGMAELAQYVDGLAAHLLLQYGPFAFIAEYIRALDEFAAAEMAFAGSGATPEAWSLEAGWTFTLLQRKTVFSLSWQGTDEALALALPEERYLAAVRMFPFAKTSVALEFLHDEDYAPSAGGTGEDGDAATMQLAVEF